ncbi:hypothetical protein AAF712_016658 [Marasmius tenuissimus]|uniref:Transposase n=1 Tax=Marasmius tenuissimus TaxID=585030 RepID=A0ABR2Z669_9AGAR
MVIVNKALTKTMTIMRVYIEHESTETFEMMFDEIQKLVLRLTNRAISFRWLQKDGNLICMNSDMCIAQVIGAGRSFLKTKDPVHGLKTDNPEVLVQHFIKLCHVHILRGIKQLEPALKNESPDVFQRLKTCTTHIQTWEDIQNFEKWVRKLNNKQVLNWWNQKRVHKWIIPCMVKSLSSINSDDWDCVPNSTNAGEAQHAWTNGETGIKLRLVEAITHAREADTATLRLYKTALADGVQQNKNNELRNRMSRSVGRTNTVIAKKKASAQQKHQQNRAKVEIAHLRQRIRELQAGGKNGHSSSPTRSRRKPERIFSDCTSSGRPKTDVVDMPEVLEIISDDGMFFKTWDQTPESCPYLTPTPEVNPAPTEPIYFDSYPHPSQPYEQKTSVTSGSSLNNEFESGIDGHSATPGLNNTVPEAEGNGTTFAHSSFNDKYVYELPAFQSKEGELTEFELESLLAELSLPSLTALYFSDNGADLSDPGAQPGNIEDFGFSFNDPDHPFLCPAPEAALSASDMLSNNFYDFVLPPPPSPIVSELVPLLSSSPSPSIVQFDNITDGIAGPEADGRLRPSWSMQYVEDREVGCTVSADNILADGSRRKRKPVSTIDYGSQTTSTISRKPTSSRKPASKHRRI